MLTIDAILLGAGLGRRFSETANPQDSTVPKQFQILSGKPVFAHALDSLLSLGVLRQVLFVVPQQYVSLAQEQVRTYVPEIHRDLVKVVTGGERRMDSSRLALEEIERSSPLATRVLIHDACRPYLSEELLMHVKNSLMDRSYGAWIPVVPVVDTLKKVENHQVVETVDRSQVHRVQTPQIFEFTVIRSLVEKVKELTDLNFTDDASLCEYYGIPVGVFPGDVRNIKLTYDFEKRMLETMITHEAATVTREKVTSCAPASDTTYTA